jgi:hypothetical protein
MRRDPECLTDPSKPCGSCAAASPRTCPYNYLLDAEELEAIVEIDEQRTRAASAEDHPPDEPR